MGARASRDSRQRGIDKCVQYTPVSELLKDQVLGGQRKVSKDGRMRAQSRLAAGVRGGVVGQKSSAQASKVVDGESLHCWQEAT